MMLQPIEPNTMNTTITMFNTNMLEKKSFLRNNIAGKTTESTKRIGMGKFSRSDGMQTVIDQCENDSVDSDDSTTMSLEEQSSCSTPRRISFQEGESESIHESLLSFIQSESMKPKKTVRFATELSEATDSNQIATKPWEGSLTEEHCRELWYSKEELALIKHDAKLAIANRASVQGNPEASCEEKDRLLGLERFSKKRAQWKKSSIRCVLMAQGQMRELNARSIYSDYIYNDYNISKEDYIQTISQRCTEWARDAAKKQGFLDYCAAHDPLASLFSDSDVENEQNYNEMIFGETSVEDTNTSNNKRKVDAVYHASNDQEEILSDRRVRHRRAALLQVV